MGDVADQEWMAIRRQSRDIRRLWPTGAPWWQIKGSLEMESMAKIGRMCIFGILIWQENRRLSEIGR